MNTSRKSTGVVGRAKLWLLKAGGCSQNTFSCPLCAGHTLVRSCSVGVVGSSAAGHSAAQGCMDTLVASRQMFRMSLRGPGGPCVHNPETSATAWQHSGFLCVLWVPVSAGGIDLAGCWYSGWPALAAPAELLSSRVCQPLGGFCRAPLSASSPFCLAVFWQLFLHQHQPIPMGSVIQTPAKGRLEPSMTFASLALLFAALQIKSCVIQE